MAVAQTEKGSPLDGRTQRVVEKTTFKEQLWALEQAVESNFSKCPTSLLELIAERREKERRMRRFDD